ncbi:recombinase family protein [Streptomyces sp. NPDC052396]|uniref:recombinase family protein n=1 Tax=Streptomyces sp. NPDC052396 TaxID=3365689 RepID=UPI0037D45A14
MRRALRQATGRLRPTLTERDHRLEIFGGLLDGMYDPQGSGKVLFVVFAVMAEVEREFIHERTLAGLDTAAANGSHGGRPPAVDMPAVALRRRDANESVTSIARRVRRSRRDHCRPQARECSDDAGLGVPCRCAADGVVEGPGTEPGRERSLREGWVSALRMASLGRFVRII